MSFATGRKIVIMKIEWYRYGKHFLVTASHREGEKRKENESAVLILY